MTTRQIARAAQRQHAGQRESKKSYRLFSQFAQRVWTHLSLPALTPAQVDIANYLQFGPSRRMIEAFRGIGKSWLTAAYVVWRLFHDPQKKILIISASKDFADTMSVFIKRLIDELPECAFLKPRGNQRNSTVQFDVGPAMADKSPSVKSVGVFGQITGSRADEIIADDVEVPKNSLTPIMRERLSEQVKEFGDIIKPDTIDGVPVPEDKLPIITYLGTPQTEMSLYNRLPERGYEIRIWTARVPGKPENYKGRLAPMIQKMIDAGAKPGTLVDPKRFSEEDLLRREMEGKSRFALQYMLDTTLTDGLKYPLRLEDLIVNSLDAERGPVSLAYGKSDDTRLKDLQPVGFTGDYYYGPAFVDKEWAPWQASILAVDPSGKGEDETAYAVLRMLHGRLYLVESGGFTGTGYSIETLQSLASVAKRHRVNEVLLEENFGSGMFGALFKPVLASIWPCSITETKAKGQKEERIIGTLEPVMNSHRLVVDPGVIAKDLEEDPVYSLFYQMTRLTKERGSLVHDDRLDALEMAVAHFQSQMEVDTEDAAERHREEELEALLAKWQEGLDEVSNMMSGGAGAALDDGETFDKTNRNQRWAEV